MTKPPARKPHSLTVFPENSAVLHTRQPKVLQCSCKDEEEIGHIQEEGEGAGEEAEEEEKRRRRRRGKGRSRKRKKNQGS